MKIALDTNVLAYAESVNGVERKLAAQAVLYGLRQHARCISVQVLGELFNVLVRKAGWPRARAKIAISGWGDSAHILPTSVPALAAAVELASQHQIQIWGAVVVASAVEAGCGLLLSEDLQHGSFSGGVLIVNPFALPRHPLLEALMEP